MIRTPPRLLRRSRPARQRRGYSIRAGRAGPSGPSAPGSFVDLVNGARHGVVAIRAGAAVKSGPAAMFPGMPEATADVSLGTGFLIESHGVFVLTNDHIAAAATDLRVVLPDRNDVPAKLVGRDLRLDLAPCCRSRSRGSSRSPWATPTSCRSASGSSSWAIRSATRSAPRSAWFRRRAARPEAR